MHILLGLVHSHTIRRLQFTSADVIRGSFYGWIGLFFVSGYGSFVILLEFGHLGSASVVFRTVTFERREAGLDSLRPVCRLKVHQIIFLMFVLQLNQMQSLKNGCLSCRDSYKSLPLGYKFYIILVITSITLGSFIADWQANLSNNTTKVIEDRQYWRLLTSLLSNGLLTAWNIILVILCLWLLKISMTSLQTKLSTAYILVELIKQTLLINLAANLSIYILIHFGMVERCIIQTGGIIIPTMFFLMQDVARDANGTFSIFGITCFLSKKYLFLLAIIGMLVLQPMNLALMLFITVFLMVEYICSKKPFVAFPIGFYQAVDRRMPNFIKSMSGYIQVQAVKDKLIEVCGEWCEPNEKQLQMQQQKKRQNINGTMQEKYKHHWINRAEELQQNIHEGHKPALKSELQLRHKEIASQQSSFSKTRIEQKIVQTPENIAVKYSPQSEYREEPVEYSTPVGYPQKPVEETVDIPRPEQQEEKDKVYNMAVNVKSSVAADDDEEEWY